MGARVHHLPGEDVLAECTLGRRKAGTGSVRLRVLFGIHLDVSLIQTTYQNIAEDQVHPFMAIRFPNCRMICPATLQIFPRSGLRHKGSGCWLDLSPSSICVVCRTNNLGPWKPYIVGFASNIFVLDTTANLQRSCEVHILMGQRDLHIIRQVVYM